MELRHLRYFVAVAGEENVSRAALKLHVSQPGLSRQIRDLEDEISFKLFERSAKSVKLTEAGKTFLVEARAVLQRAEDAVKAARVVAAGSHGELHVGYAPSLAVRILPAALRAFQTERPHVRVKLYDLSIEEMHTGLREGKLELAFLVRPPTAKLRGLQFEELTREAIRLAVAPKHLLAKKRVVTLEEAAREPFIAYNRIDYPEYPQIFADIFSATKTKPRIAEEHDGVTSLIAAVEAGGGVALVAESVACIAGARVKLIRLSPSPEPVVVGAAWPKAGLSPAAERFLACARKTLPGK
jgi:LysR family transcriptional regulator, benzoate and cis,cis-muconate-responsive activator of ben and cat genes